MLRILVKKFALTAILAAALALTACGGGGGSSTSSTSTMARLTTANALTFANIVDLSYYTSNASLSFLSRTTNENPQDGNKLQKVTKMLSELAIKKLGSNAYQARTIDSIDACSGGGSIAATGNVDDTTSTGTLAFTLNYCVEDGLTMNGKATVNISTNTSTQFVATITYNNLSVDDSYDVVVMKGTQNINATSNQYTVTSNLSFTLNATEQVEQKQLVVTENSSGTTASGTLCLSGEGCVTLETKTPVEFEYYGPYSGEIVLHGTNSNLQILIINGVASVNLDADGDGTFETPMASGTAQ